MEASAHLFSSFGIKLELQYQWIGRQYLNDANDQSYGAYHLFHMKLAYSKKLRMIDLGLAVGIRNLLDSKHASMILVNAPSFGGNLPRYYYPGMPRNYFLTLSLGF
jgi:iron complex outermembrane receptor protein